MNIDILNKSFDLFQADGYNRSIEDFKNLIKNNPSALKTAYGLYVDDGNNISFDDYKNELQVEEKPEQADEQPPQGEPPVKKKEEPKPRAKKPSGGSKPAGGSSVSQKVEPQPQPPYSAIGYQSVIADINKQQQSTLLPQPPQKPQPFPDYRKATWPSSETKKQQLSYEFKRDDFYPAPPQALGDNTRIARTPSMLTDKEIKDMKFSPVTPLDIALNNINTGDISSEEEEVVPKMRYLFGDYGFNFEKTGLMDAMNVTAPNGETIEIDLDPILNSTENSELRKLKKFVRDNAPKGLERDKIEKSFNQYKKQFYSEDEVKESISALSNEVNLLNSDINKYSLDKIKLDDEVKIINQTPRDKRFTPEYNKKMKELADRSSELYSRKSELQKKILNNESNQAMLEKSVGKYSQMLADVEAGKGNLLGSIWNAALTGVGRMSSGVGSLLVDATGEIAQFAGEQIYSTAQMIEAANKLGYNPPFYAGSMSDQAVNEWWATMTPDQREKIDDLATDLWKKSVKYGDEETGEIGMLDYARNFYTKSIGDPTTTQAYIDDLKQKSFLGRVVLGVAESVPAFMTPGGFAMRTASLYAQTSDAVNEEMSKIPEFKDVSEGEKFLVQAPVGIATAVLEEFGFSNAISKKGLLNDIIIGALGKSGKVTTATTFKELVENEIESRIARGALVFTGAGLAEAETGMAQQVFEFAVKDIYNLAKEKEMFKTPEGFRDYAVEVLMAGAEEAVGGLILGTPSAVATAYKDNNFNGIDDLKMDIFSAFVNDANIKKAILVDVKNKVISGAMTLDEGRQLVSNYDAAGGLLNSLPESIDNAGKRKALGLLLERRAIESSIQGKEEALIKPQRERISKINSELEKIGIENAIQEQTTDEGVLRQEGPEVELQKMVEGDQVAQVPTEEGKKEEVTPESIKSLDKADVIELAKLAGIESNWNMEGEGDLISGKSGVDAYTQRMLPDWNRSSQLGEINPESKLTYDIVRGEFGGVDQKNTVTAKDENGVTVGMIQMDSDGGILHLAVAPEFRGKGVAENLYSELKNNNPNADLSKTKNRSIGFEKSLGAIGIAEAYTKAKSEGTNQDLVNSVESLIYGKPTTETGAAVQPTAAVTEEQVTAPAVQEGAVGAVSPTAEPTATVRGVVSVSDQAQVDELSTRVTDPLRKRIVEQAKRAINTIKSVLPDFDIVIHENEDSYNAEMDKIGVDRETGGVFDFETKKIHINLSKAKASTVAHEVAHGVMLRAFGTNPALFKQFRDRMSMILSEDTNKNLSEFASEYNEENSHEEYLVELVGMLASQQGKIAPTTIHKIAALINKIVSKITGGSISPLSEKATEKELIDFLNGMANAIRTGQEVGFTSETTLPEGVTRAQLATEGTALKVKGNEPIKAGKTLPVIKMKDGREMDDYSFDDIMESTLSPNSRAVTMATDISSGTITYRTKEGVLKSFPLPYINKKANSDIRRLKNKYKSIQGTSKEARAKKQKLIEAINTSAKEVMSDFVNTMSQNILAMYDFLSDQFVDSAKRWYEGANRIAQSMANSYGKTTEQSAAIIAVLSPKNDWFNNVSCAERVMDILNKHSDVKLNKDIVDKAVAYNSRTKEGGGFVDAIKNLFEEMGEVSINDLAAIENSGDAQAILLRAIDHAYNSPKVAKTNSDGKVIGFDKAPIRWASYSMIMRAVSVYRDGSPENISINLGGGNKVRNFYNNIVDPKSKTPYVTSDTHALSAALNLPISSEDAQGMKLFEGQMEPVYALVKQAYIDAANVVGIQPREMQSITWEGTRETINQKDRQASVKEESFNIVTNSRENKQTPYDRATEHIQRRSDRLQSNNGVSGNAKSKTQQRVSALSALRGRLAGGPVGAAETGVDRRAAGRGADGATARVKPKAQILGETGASRITNSEKSIVDLAVAKEMEKAGKDVNAIRMATGWERGADNQWRLEIPDGKLKPIDLGALPVDEEGRSYTTLGEIYDHEELYKAYDQEVESMRFIDDKTSTEYVTGIIPVDRKFKKLRDTRVVFDPRLRRGEGSYNGKENRIMLSPFSVPNPRATQYNMREQEMDFLPTLIHEIQHSVQDREFFEQGANSNTAVEYAAMKAVMLQQIVEDRQKLYDEQSLKEQTPVSREMMKDLKNRIDEARRRSDTFMDKVGKLGQYEVYKRTAGEVEARNAADRLRLSEKERRALSLKLTEDVAREDQIILNDAFLGTPERAAESRPKPKAQKLGEGKPEGYDRLMNRVNDVMKRARKRGQSNEEALESVIKNVQANSQEYANATDTQREQIIRDIREMFGKKEKAAPSTNKILGGIKNVTKITANEMTLLKKQIKDLARGARDAKNAWRQASKQLSDEINELVGSGKITLKQAGNIINRFASVNMFDPASIDKFAEYMERVMANAEYQENISTAKNLIPKAKNNLRKLGIATGLMPNLQRMLAINPTYIPESVFGKYRLLLEMLGKRDAVLELEEINKVKQDVNDVLDAVNEQETLAYELKDVFDSFADKVLDENGDVDFGATIDKMIEANSIDNAMAKVMKKYKSVIAPSEKTEVEERFSEEEVDQMRNAVSDAQLGDSLIDSRLERDLVSKLRRLLKSPAVNTLTGTELYNLLRVIDNINNGYVTHMAQLMVERLDANNDGDILQRALMRAKLLTLSKHYANLKKKILGKKDAYLTMLERNPWFNVDQLLGDFKTKEVFNAIFQKIASASSKYESETRNIAERLEKAEFKILKSNKFNHNKTMMSKFKIMTYLLELENQSNPGSKKVSKASEFLKKTIELIESGKSQYNERDAKMLQKILDNKKWFDSDGNMDVNELYRSFNRAEIDAINVIQDINKENTEKAIYTQVIIRGEKMDVIDNYVHHNTITPTRPDEKIESLNNIRGINNNMMPSTRGKSLISRTPGAKAINFDPFQATQRGADYVLLDYHMTVPIRTMRKAIRFAESKMKEDKAPKEKMKILNAIDNGVEQTIHNTLATHYMTSSIAMKAMDYIKKTGYRAILASVARFIGELTSNTSYALIAARGAFLKGVSPAVRRVFMSAMGIDVMKNVGSVQVTRLYPSDTLSGRLVDSSIMQDAMGSKNSMTKNAIANKMAQINSMTLKPFRGAIETVADAMISTPDKMISRPIWFGSFANEFKSLTGMNPDFDLIANNDEGYMNAHADAIRAAREKADNDSIQAGASDNPFVGILKGTVTPDQDGFVKFFNQFNNFMTRFLIYEYTTARTGVMAMIGRGSITKAQGAALLGGITSRMVIYNFLVSTISNAISGIFVDDEEEEEDDKSLLQKFGQSFISGMSSLVIGRDFGNVTKSVLNYGMEKVNEKHFDFLREGEYDPHKDMIQYNPFPKSEPGNPIGLTDYVIAMSGPYAPMLKSTELTIKKADQFFNKPPKDEDAIERLNRNLQQRIPLEWAGHLGMIPLYKDIHNILVKDINKTIKSDKQKEKEKEEKEEEKRRKKMQKENEVFYGPKKPQSERSRNKNEVFYGPKKPQSERSRNKNEVFYGPVKPKSE